MELWLRHLERWPDLPAMLQDSGIAIAGLGLVRLGDPTADRRWFDVAGTLGASYVAADYNASAFPDGIAGSADLARASRVRIAIHNHGAPHWLGNARMLQRFLELAPEEFGLCLDTAWALDSREDPVAMIRLLGSRLLAVHLKDFTFDQGRAPREVPLGDGGVALPAVIAELRSLAFDGWCVVETETQGISPSVAGKLLSKFLQA